MNPQILEPYRWIKIYHWIWKKEVTIIRSFIGLLLILTTFYVRNSDAGSIDKKVFVLGLDGIDPVLLKTYMDEDILPNFKKLKEIGGFLPLTTSMPPQSAVAWSDFITGMNTGGHGIIDFIARDPMTYHPYLSTSKTIEPQKSIKIGDWIIPFSRGEVNLLRKGKAFWEILESKGIPTVVIKIPSNFPPVKTEGVSLSGMGTPDILGTYGTFSFYTTETEIGAEIGGNVFNVSVKDNTVKAAITGPVNNFRKDRDRVNIDFIVKIDPEYPVAKIIIQGKEIMLNEKEWSDWIKVEYKFLPFYSVTGILRFFLKEIRPDFKLYVSPVNIDPSNPALPISNPEKYSKELTKAIGYYYTQGMPEDTWALNNNRIDNEDFLHLSDFILEERIKMLEVEMKKFKSGLFFIYFPTADPIQHMFWRNIDPQHPGYNAEEAKIYYSVIPDTYKKMDNILGQIMKNLDNDDRTTLIVLSDHGFGPLKRFFNLNSWLRENGYISFLNEAMIESGELFQNVDWERTKAYALGLNALYINLKGREGKGIVPPEEKESLMDELIKKLSEVRDSKNGKRIIKKIYKSREIYSGRYINDSPDLIIGYNKGYRTSWESALGKITKDMIYDNMKKWSGDHLIDYKLVPGILLTNKKIKIKSPTIRDIAPTILREFGIDKEEEMVGQNIF